MTNSHTVDRELCDNPVIASTTPQRADAIVLLHHCCEPPCPRKRSALLYLYTCVAASLRKLVDGKAVPVDDEPEG